MATLRPEDTARAVFVSGRLSVNVALLNYAKWIREVFRL